MALLRDRWNQHLTENEQTYCQHFRFAAGAAVCIIYYGVKLIIHAITPCFNRTALKDTERFAAERRTDANWKNIDGRRREVKSNNEYTNYRVCTPSIKKNN